MTTTTTTAPVQLGTARRVNMPTARARFHAGATILVHNGHELELPVTEITTVHTRDRITWDELAGMVDTWRNRYPAQGYYVVTYAPNTCTFPPVRVPVPDLVPGDILPVCAFGTVVTVRPHIPGAVMVTTSTGRDVMLYTDELVHVSREVTR